ncbi:MAG: CRISPR-associated helicase Cas3', partial [Methanococcoides sp.]|nr:CRISPR-associated helicase Cas3' [Methanococcoides sp.]
SAHQLIKQLDDNICACYEKKFKIPEKGEFTTTQKKCVESLGETAILKAPTGTGKTEASFLWANENIKKIPYSRIFYILPYTASINAMFERLNTSDFSKDKVDLLHGKSTSYYFELFTKDIPDEDIEENIKEINKKVRLQRLTAKSFVNPIKIVTPHQIVKNFYGLKHFEESFIQYTKGLFIFDEIHCYDKVFLAELIVATKKIKDDFNGKFLFMSATFPRIIENLLSKYLEIKHPTIEFNDSELHKYTKTKLNLMDGLIDNFLNIKKIQNDIDNGKRILIVCNTVNKAQEVFKQIECPKKLMLHSAFNVNDRKGIEQEIIESEKKDNNEKNQVLIGTQAIEVSLDLDY